MFVCLTFNIRRGQVVAWLGMAFGLGLERGLGVTAGLALCRHSRAAVAFVRHTNTYMRTRKCGSKLLTTRRMRNAGLALPCPYTLCPTFAYAPNLSWLRHFNCKLAWRVSFAVAI